MKKKELTYEEAMQEVEKLISRIENEEVDMDSLAENIKQASSYLKFCKEKLYKVNEEIEKILDESSEG